MTNSRDDLNKEYDNRRREIEALIGGVSWEFAEVDELLREIICDLVDHKTPGKGQAVYNTVATNVHRKCKLISKLAEEHSGLDDLINDLNECLKKIKEDATTRAEVIHNVIKGYVGRGVTFMTNSLRNQQEAEEIDIAKIKELKHNIVAQKTRLTHLSMQIEGITNGAHKVTPS